MNETMPLENQLLVTKFYMPVAPGALISRPRLIDLLNESWKYPLTLVSAAAGFGKTTLLASWAQSLQARGPRVAWVSLEEEDNEPRLFWAYVLTALNRQLPERFTSLLTLLQSPQSPPLTTLLAELINLLAEGRDDFLLILDDYHLITEPQVHTTLTYLIEHLPAQLHVIVATRADPAVPLPLLRSRRKVLEVRTDQLRCTVEETRAFLDEVMGIHLPDETIQEITARTEGWLVGLQLLGLSLPDRLNPEELLKEISGDQRYILDFLTEEVLRRQPQEIQTFLLCTSILEERFTASLCNAVMEQTGSQQMLQQIEQANLFVVSLDSRQQWYRYHALFTEALYHYLEQRHPDLVPLLHHRASIWYAEHDQMTEAILHALRAQKWEWAADLIERKSLPLMAHAWGVSQHVLTLLHQWVGQLPTEIMHARPLLCFSCSVLLMQVAPFSMLDGWLGTAEAILTAGFTIQTHGDALPTMFTLQMQQEQQHLRGAITSFRAVLRFFEGDGWTALALCKQALTLVSVDDLIFRSQILLNQAVISSTSDVNDVKVGIEVGLQAVSLAQQSGLTSLALTVIGSVAISMIEAGQLHEAQRLTQQAMLLGKPLGGPVLPELGYPSSLQAEILREWNELDAAQSLAEEAISLSEQVILPSSLIYALIEYGMLLRIYLSRGELDVAYSVLQQIKSVGTRLNRPYYIHMLSIFTTVDQVRLWLACGELDQATRWIKELDETQRHSNSFICEREDMACVRILLAMDQAHPALQRLGPALQRAAEGQRWGHVIEIRLLQALAHRKLQEEMQALHALSEAVRLTEPEGYIRSFVDEGTPMEDLLYRLRKRDRKNGPTPYLDTLLAAFQQERMARVQSEERAQAQALPEPLSKRELEILQLLARGASNQEIAQELVIAYDTVKRHVSHIFGKLGVNNRVQAIRQAQILGLLDEKGG